MKKILFTLCFAVISIALFGQTGKTKWRVDCNSCEVVEEKNCQDCAGKIWKSKYLDGVTIGPHFVPAPFKKLEADKTINRINITDANGNNWFFTLRKSVYYDIDSFFDAIVTCVDKCNGGGTGGGLDEDPANELQDIQILNDTIIQLINADTRIAGQVDLCNSVANCSFLQGLVGDVSQVNDSLSITYADGTTVYFDNAFTEGLPSVCPAGSLLLYNGTMWTCYDTTNLVTVNTTLLTVNSGTTSTTTDNVNGTADVVVGDIIHFWSSDETVDINVTQGSAIVDITANGNNCIETAVPFPANTFTAVAFDSTTNVYREFVWATDAGVRCISGITTGDGKVCRSTIVDNVENLPNGFYYLTENGFSLYADTVNLIKAFEVKGSDVFTFEGDCSLTSENRESECTTTITETAHGITYTELQPIWYTGGQYVDNLPIGADTFPPVGLLKSMPDANSLELIRCGFEETSYADGYYYATNTGISLTPITDNQTPIFIAHGGVASISVDHVYFESESITLPVHEKTIVELSDTSHIVIDSVFLEGVFQYAYSDTLIESCYALSDPFIVDIAKVLTSDAAFTNMTMNGTPVVWNDLNSATSSGDGQISLNGTSSANSASSMQLGILSMEVAAVSSTGMAATVGLSYVDYSTARFTADYELYFGVGGNIIQIRENGNLIFASGTGFYSVGDVFAIEIAETEVIFRKNGTEIVRVSGLDLENECLTTKEHLILLNEEKINEVVTLTHTPFSQAVTVSDSESFFVVPASLHNTDFSIIYGSPNDLDGGGGMNFQASAIIYRAGTAITGLAPLNIGTSIYSGTGISTTQAQEGDVIVISVDQLGNSVPNGFSASINFTN